MKAFFAASFLGASAGLWIATILFIVLPLLALYCAKTFVKDV